MIRRWIRDWFLIDALALGAGVLATVLYIVFSDQLSQQYESYKNVWSNLGTEILGVWISVRIIDALIRAREERDHVRNRVVGNLNFMMQICQNLPPHFDEWRRNEIENELTWFNEKRRAPVTSKQLRKYFSAEELAAIEDVVERVTAIHSLAKRVAPARSKFTRMADTDFRWDSPKEVEELFKAASRYNHGESHDESELHHGLTVVREKLKQGQYESPRSTQITELCDSIDEQLSLMRESQEAVLALEKALANFRRRMADTQ